MTRDPREHPRQDLASTKMVDPGSKAFVQAPDRESQAPSERQQRAEQDLERQGREVSDSFRDEFDRLSQEGAFRYDPAVDRKPVQYQEGPPPLEALKVLRDLTEGPGLSQTTVIHWRTGYFLGG